MEMWLLTVNCWVYIKTYSILGEFLAKNKAAGVVGVKLKLYYTKIQQGREY